MADLSKVWKALIGHPGKKPAGGAKRREYNRESRRYKSYKLVIELIQKHEPKLADGKQGIHIPKDRINKLLEIIHESCPPRDVKLCHNFFIKGLSAGVKKEKWAVYVPAVMTVVDRHRSPFTPSNFVSIKALSILKEKFKSSLANPLFYHDDSPYLLNVKITKKAPDLDIAQLHAGQIIFSAIVNGALLNKKWLNQLGDGIKDNVIVDANFVWVEINKGEEIADTENTLYRRWFPDPLTSLLVLRWKKKYVNYWPTQGADKKEGQPQFLLKRYLESLGIKTKDQPTLSQLIKASNIHLGLRLPQFLIKYACSYDTGLSLQPSAWARLYKSLALKEDYKINNSMLLEEFDKNKIYSSFNSDLPIKYGDQLKRLRNFKEVFKVSKAPTAHQVNGAIETFIETTEGISPVLMALIRWSQDMMSNQRIIGKKLRPSSMKRYLSAIAQPLLLHLLALKMVDRELVDVDWVVLYERVLGENIREINRNYKAGRLLEFHRFLVQRYYCKSVAIKYGGRISSRVDVNIVTPKEYTSARNSLLSNSNETARIRKMQSIILALGYRCGLRANEALTLKITDIHDGQNIDGSIRVGRPELLIVDSIHGKVKNKSSIRRIPLLLLMKDELKDLISWKKLRLNEIRASNKNKLTNEPLFCLKSEDKTSAGYHEIFPTILTALKKVSGDQSVNYHHLRHSFANFLFLRLISDDIEGLLPEEWLFDESSQKYLLWEGKKQHSNTSLRSQLLVKNKSEPSRKLLYMVSTLCGHIDPSETLNSYLHLIDWILAHFLKNVIQPVTTMEQTNLLSLTPKKLKSYRNRNRLKGETYSLDLLGIEVKKSSKKYPNYQLKEMKPAEIVKVQLPENKQEKPPSPFYLHSIFARVYIGIKLNDIADDYGITMQQLMSWVSCAKKLASERTERDTLRFFRNEKQFEIPKDLSLLRTIPHFSPTPPHGQKEREEATEIYLKLHELYSRDKELATRGLNLFLKNATFEKTIITTRTDEKRVSFVRFMEKLVLKRQIHVELEPNPDKEMKAQLNYWRKKLALPKSNFSLANENRSQATLHHQGKVNIWISRKNQKRSEKKAHHIIRFALFMGFVSLNHL